VSLWLFAAGGLALAADQNSVRLEQTPRPTRILGVFALVAVAAIPATTLLGHRALNRANEALHDDRCPAALRFSQEANGVVDGLAEPYEIRAWCSARLGRGEEALAAISQAIQRDPENWRYRYGLAVMRGVNGLDPRRSATRAQRMNPRDAQALALVRSLESAGAPAEWENIARNTPLPTR
jgi:tetratricopeptide (TPR) repeat protein